MIKTLLASLAMLGAQANAARLTCSTSYAGYDAVAYASTKGNAILGSVQIITTHSGQTTREVYSVIASDIRPLQSISFSDQNQTGSGVLTATYEAESKLYSGQVSIHTPMGSMSIPVTCVLN